MDLWDLMTPEKKLEAVNFGLAKLAKMMTSFDEKLLFLAGATDELSKIVVRLEARVETIENKIIELDKDVMPIRKIGLTQDQVLHPNPFRADP
jgi:hypothetical protein